MTTEDDLAQCQAGCGLVLAFFAALDQRRHDEVAAMMADEGVWHRQGQALQGPAAVAQALAARDPARHTAHVVTNLRAEVLDAGRTRVRFYLVAYESRTGGAPQSGAGEAGAATTSAHAAGAAAPRPADATAPRLVAIRICEDELVRTPAGWRFALRTSQPLLPPPAPAAA